MARTEHDHRLAVGRLHDVTGIRRDARPLGKRAEVERLEVRECRVLALDVHDRLERRRALAVVQRCDLELVPGGLPERGELAADLEDLACDGFVARPVELRQREPGRVKALLRGEVALEERLGESAVAIAAGADVEDRERLVCAHDDRVGMLLEDLHRHTVVSCVALEDQLGAGEIDVALVSGADLLDRQAKDLRGEAVGDDHVAAGVARKSSRIPAPVWVRSTGGPPASASLIRSTCSGAVFAGSESIAK